MFHGIIIRLLSGRKHGGILLHRFISIFVCLIFVATGCADKIVSECENNSPDNIVKANFSEIQSKIITPTCATTGCHTGPSPTGDLDLSAGKAFANLVNIKSGEDPQFLRVSPGKSSESFIIHKLNGLDTSVMPPSGKLDQALIDSIAVWIDRGALND